MNLRSLASLYIILIGALFSSCSHSPSSYVRPFVGTDATGHTFPGATTPFGMVQLSPDTRIDGSWEGCSGYHYSDSLIYGFSHTHLSGTGVSDYGDMLIMAQTGTPSFDPSAYAATFHHENEHAEAGYYTVGLDNGIQVALTATTRVGMHRYRFPKGKASLILDLHHRDHLTDGGIEVQGSNRLAAYRISSAWAREQHVYAQLETSADFEPQFNHDSTKVILHLPEGTSVVDVRVGLSFTGAEGAQKNLAAEVQHWDFDRVRSDASVAWNEALSVIEVKDDDPEKVATFYTALYHTMIHPNTAMDVDGTYRGMDNELHVAEDFVYYTVFSLWDTFRAAHPLYTIIDRKRSLDFVKTMLRMYQEGGRLPVWELCSNETDCMIGYHSVSVIADALSKGIDDVDQELALEAMQESATWDHLGLPAYQRQGFLSVEDEHESVSKTLEYAYDDWCIAQMAGRLGKPDIYGRYIRRSQAWRNLLDPSTGLMRPRVNGGWLEPFEPREVNNHFTEGNAWQYSFFVPHDIPGLIKAIGGREAFEAKLDDLFTAAPDTKGRTQPDITGMIGQYAHGNEPSHHMAYLYHFVDRPEKSTERVHQILSKFYTTAPDGLIGNEDCGQMSAWYVMSALGIYAIAPGKAEYALVEPFLDDYTVHPDEGTPFDRQSIDEARREGNFISHARLTGTETPSFTPPETEIFYVQPPVISAPALSFDDSIEVSFTAPEGQNLSYSLRTTEGVTHGLTDPKVTLYETTWIEAFSAKDSNDSIHWSPMISAKFVRHPHPEWEVELLSTYNPQYSAGGPKGLIDGLHGDRNWRKGFWQGYQGQDFVAIIDMQEPHELVSFGSQYLEDVRSWIVYPTSVSYAVSDDGMTFREVSTHLLDQPPQSEGLGMKGVIQNVWPPITCRYVKVRAKNYGTLPEWHPGHGGEAFIFIDEIELGER